MTYTWSDIEDLDPQWRELFGESVPMGFCITPAQVPILRECIRTRSQKPIDDYVRSLPAGDDY